ncbi:hypothetical protein EJV47_27155 [Hymenobacter gummosus]|uniref:Glycosyl hydrolase family 13 catalytic domain-containing protein n=1 Tax=Hymenobacter gummosus TaxID=1776032 RepID=A0A431TUK0_9BACT|nr:alpha-amylase domain-containing protein [Hymenobacter gummosus]RTQ44886.1 hypothetical protein EJV47_27155 [Hymenobacter gummosus]
MQQSYSRRSRRWPLLLALLLLFGLTGQAQQTHKKVVLQAFWWDYWNSNYPAGWANYLVDLAPRLKSMGIDAVWIPPTSKNKNAVSDVGYSPFDHYDLGDKYQKGGTGTRVGTKDELLRLIAVLHANGIEVIQDVVLNHADGAGTNTGAGGQDPEPNYSLPTNSGYKTFRYACYATPLPETGETAAEYLVRQGRWTKNYPNFHGHLGHNDTGQPMTAPYFGPDFCYGDDGGSDGYGPSTNSGYNPTQGPGYSRDQARSWLLWLKKQTAVDGFRWDAVKHFSYAAQQDWSYNLKYLAGWANGGEAMFNVGEYVGGKNELDGYVNDVRYRNNGSEFLMGTFDFGLREGLNNMVNGNGGFDIGTLPDYQQAQAVAQYGSGASAVYVHRTVPFVNNHDTFRPQLSATGNYTGWNTGSELAPHIDPFNPRLSVAYAVAFAFDGSPQVFFEDLFNVGGTGKRFSHLPSSTTDLPVRDDLVNLIWCHQNLRFKDGAFKKRGQSPDHLIIERSAKALIGINDNWDTWQQTWVDSDFAPGTVLKDYSGANGSATYTVPQDQRVPVNTPPCNGSALGGRRGYSVWAPVGQDANNVLPARATATTQEWELADDLGDRNCQSLGQGGRLPDNSTNQRVVGKIYVQAGQAVSYELYPELPNTGRQLTFGLYDLQGSRLHTASGAATITGTYTPATTGWLALKLRNTAATYGGQRCYVKVTYTAPTGPDARTTLAANTAAIWTGNDNSTDPTNCRNWEGGLLPAAGVDVLVPAGSSVMPDLSGGTLLARHLTVEAGAALTLDAGTTLRLTGNLTAAGTLTAGGTVELAGSSTQTLSGPGLSFAGLTINNPADVRLLSPVSVTGALTFSSGHLVLDDQNLTLTATATISGADQSRYVVTKNDPASGGAVVRPVAVGTTVLYPVGTAASYTPLSLLNTGSTTATVPVRVAGAVLQNGTSGAPHAQATAFVNRTWDVSPSGPLTADMTFQWNSSDENAGFDRSRAAVMHYNGNGSWGSYASSAVSGSGPYTLTAAGVSSFSPFSVGTSGTVLPVMLLRFAAERQSGGAVLLRWATAQEQDNAYFEVEKSTDGRSFRALGRVAGQGTSSHRHDYQLRDAAAPQAAYYRLRQVDTDGRATLSAVQYVAGGTPSLTLTPNPTTGEVRLLGLPADASLQLTLRTAAGRTAYEGRQLTPAAAEQQLSETLRRLAPGVYMLTIGLEGGPQQHLKVLKQ